MNRYNRIRSIQGSVTAPRGFIANGINCGLRKERPDIGLLFSLTPCVAAGAFTRNLVKAAPVRFCMKNLANPIHAVFVNSRIANACTGPRGYQDTVSISRMVSDLLGIKPQNVLVASTGIIGRFLDMRKIGAGLKELAPGLNRKGNRNMARAILTTDTKEKEIAVEFRIKGKKVKLGGIAKGSGMIAPDMATLLAFLTSDIKIEKKILQKIFSEVISRTFNAITIDGDMSTNDTALILCNGQAGNDTLTAKDKKDLAVFRDHLYYVLNDLSVKLVKDGEGVTRFVRLHVVHAADRSQAGAIGFKIANSPLVKTAFYGSDANWGRILGAAGAAGVHFNPEKVEVRFGPYTLCRKGAPVTFSEGLLKKYLSRGEIDVTIDLHQGKESFVIYTSDLTEDYIRINAHYRS
ncbi:MAG: bifunctional glutamate N-acetyltransferase/amino-acid acetyltransferase ArgJ [bacterium]|nr:bifunctional glutamate N-acetyltransferase/amino-acid acetyltransferase ArgJ [bacterium]